MFGISPFTWSVIGFFVVVFLYVGIKHYKRIRGKK